MEVRRVSGLLVIPILTLPSASVGMPPLMLPSGVIFPMYVPLNFFISRSSNSKG